MNDYRQMAERAPEAPMGRIIALLVGFVLLAVWQSLALISARMERDQERQARCRAELQLMRYERPSKAAEAHLALLRTLPEHVCGALERVRQVRQ